ncbi:SURF1 family protein [Methylocucumis oryzae]|uniref:SURF1-like protein n=1 Tax=Methylocucumis oryzae TaxID=1632867 RepID=A0A0F3IQP9_9GAMM|nr:SURF1 family protein [Methylocucumis oryzae]KJV07924.1 hypothetical protein VZ94_01430 [Methylocucumis oryzae]
MGNRFLIWLAYLILSFILLSLSHWQWRRADEKTVLLATEASAAQQAPVNITELINHGLDSIRYRAVRLSGHYDTEHQFLLDNQIVNGKAGYFVLTPFIIKGLDKAVLVNRGWIPLTASRALLPDVKFQAKQYDSIEGRVNYFPSIGIELSDAAKPSEHWPALVQVVHSELLSAKLGYSLLPVQIELTSLQPNGYVRQWRMTTLLSPEQHIAYSLQWLGLALTLTVLFAWYSFKSHYGRSTKKE